MSDEYDEDDLEALQALEEYERSSQASQLTKAPGGPSGAVPTVRQRAAPPAGLPPPPDINPDEEEQFYDDEPPPDQMHPDDWEAPPSVNGPKPSGHSFATHQSHQRGRDDAGPGLWGNNQDAPGEIDAPVMECHCGGGLCTVLTANTTSNPGRQFFKCPKPRGEQCNFFQWVDEAPKVLAADGRRGPAAASGGFGGGGGLSSNSGWAGDNGSSGGPGGTWNGPAGAQKRKQPEGLPGGMDAPPIECPCDAGPCVVLTSNTVSNPNRQFFKCPKPQGEQCGFFQWVDEGGQDKKSLGGGGFASNPGGRGGDWGSPPKGDTRQNNKSPGGGLWASPGAQVPGSGSCFKCGGGGHWARDCPNASGGGGFGAGRGMGGGGENWGSPGARGPAGSNNTCFKCGQEGHWASSCPNAVGGGGGGRGMGGNMGGGGGGSCYKCGQSGHWARDCRA